MENGNATATPETKPYLSLMLEFSSDAEVAVLAEDDDNPQGRCQVAIYQSPIIGSITFFAPTMAAGQALCDALRFCIPTQGTK